jgi:hypothetical protein
VFNKKLITKYYFRFLLLLLLLLFILINRAIKNLTHSALNPKISLLPLNNTNINNIQSMNPIEPYMDETGKKIIIMKLLLNVSVLYNYLYYLFIIYIYIRFY